MRKILSALFLISILLLTVACNNADIETQNTTIEDTAQEWFEEDEGDRSIWYDYAIYSFEEAMESSDAIFIGKPISKEYGTNVLGLTGKNASGVPLDYKVYTFEITDVIFEGCFKAPEIVHIYVFDDRNMEYNPYEVCQFSKEYEYLLPLEISDYVDAKHDMYFLSGSAVICLDPEGYKSSSLNGENSLMTAKGVDYCKEYDREGLINYVKELSANNQSSQLYVHSDDLREIVDFSQVICEVQVDELICEYKSDVRNAEYYRCTLLSKIKDEGLVGVRNNICVAFTGGTVKPGDKVTVGLVLFSMGDGRDIAEPIYTLSSKVSLFNEEQKTEISEILKSEP